MKIRIVLRKVLVIVLILLYIFALSLFSLLLVFRNKYGLIETKNNYYFSNCKRSKTKGYNDGDLIVIKKTDFNKVKVNDDVFVYEEIINSKNINVINSKVEKVKLDADPGYITLKNDNRHWISDELL